MKRIIFIKFDNFIFNYLLKGYLDMNLYIVSHIDIFLKNTDLYSERFTIMMNIHFKTVKNCMKRYQQFFTILEHIDIKI